MLELFLEWFPNYAKTGNEFIAAIFQTIEMFLYSGIFSFVIGTFLGVILTVSKRNGILQNKWIYDVLDKTINLIRSVPYVVLIILLFPLSRLIVGSAIGVKGAIIPLIIGTVPFFARQIETAISEVDKGLVEAAQSMGLSPLAIVFRVYLKESIPSIVRVTMITAVNLISLTAMAGAVGAGGLGDFAIRVGHGLKYWDMLWLTIFVILIMVSIIQAIGNLMIRKTTH